MQRLSNHRPGNMLVRYPELGAATTIAKLMGTSGHDESIAVNLLPGTWLSIPGWQTWTVWPVVSRLRCDLEEGVTGEDLQAVMASYVRRAVGLRLSRWMKNVYINANESTVNQLRDKLYRRRKEDTCRGDGAALPDRYAKSAWECMYR